MRKLIKNSTDYLLGNSETHCISMGLHYDETGTVQPVLSKQLRDSQKVPCLIQACFNVHMPFADTEYLLA